MARSIQIKSTLLKIPFVDEEGNEQLELVLDKKDLTETKIRELQNEMLEKVALMSNDEEMATYEELELVLRHVFDGLFSEGSFDKVYELTPSWNILLIYLVEIIEIIKEETQLEFEQVKTSLDKYMG